MAAALSDAIVVAVSRLVDDAQGERRDPSHADLEFRIDRAGLSAADPNRQGQTVGKAKRVRATLQWALEHSPEAGERLVESLISHIRACGGFREGSPNYVGADAIANAIAAFDGEGFVLGVDGDLHPLALENLSGTALTAALQAYVRRAQRGIADAALLTGTGKDLVEATAAHVLTERYGSYPATANFPTLLGQAFVCLGLATPQTIQATGSAVEQRLEASLYEIGCSLNAVRNKQGTGHGRPWLPTISEVQGRMFIELMGSVAAYLLWAHSNRP